MENRNFFYKPRYYTFDIFNLKYILCFEYEFHEEIGSHIFVVKMKDYF